MSNRVNTVPGDSIQAGYKAWLDYKRIEPGERNELTAAWCSRIAVNDKSTSVVMDSAVSELIRGIEAMLGSKPVIVSLEEAAAGEGGYLIIGTLDEGGSLLDRTFDGQARQAIGPEGYAIRANREERCIAIGAQTDAGVLYGVFAFLRLLGTGSALESLDLTDHPVNSLRMMNQWDNIDGSIERGYAGKSIFLCRS